MTPDGGRKGTARVCVLSIIEEEFDAVHASLGPLQQILGSKYWSPDPVELDLVATRSPNRSNVPAGLAAAAMLENYRPEVLVVVGIGAAIVRDGTGHAFLGDVVVPEYLHYSEFAKIAKGRHLQRYLPYDQPSADLLMTYVDAAHRGREWQNRINVSPPQMLTRLHGEWPDVHVGSLLATEKILSDPDDEFQHMVVRQQPDAIAVDMESFGVATALHDARISVNYNPRFLVIRGVSDLVYERRSVSLGRVGDRVRKMLRVAIASVDPRSNQKQRDEWKRYSAAVAAAFAADVVGRILAVPDQRPGSRHEEIERRRDAK